MKRIRIVDEVEFNNDGKVINLKGHFEPVRVTHKLGERQFKNKSIKCNTLTTHNFKDLNDDTICEWCHKSVLDVRMTNTFSDRTLKVMFWEQFSDSNKDFYCGG